MPIGLREYFLGLRALKYYQNPFKFLDVEPSLTNSLDSEKDEMLPLFINKQRAKLIWFCQTLWARTSEEKQIIFQAIVHEVSQPENGLTLKCLRQYDLMKSNRKTKLSKKKKVRYLYDEPEPTYPFLKQETKNEKVQAEPIKHLKESKKKNESKNEKDKNKSSAFRGKNEEFGVDVIGNSKSKFNMSLPELNDNLPLEKESFIIQLKSNIPELWLLELWRRLFKPTKLPEYRRVDVVETVRKIAITGTLLSPVMETRFVNKAKLLVFVDISEAMQPWSVFEAMLVNTLTSNLSRMPETKIYYFDGAPGDEVYKTKGLQVPKKLCDLLKDHEGDSILIFGEAGAAQGHFTQRMASRIKNFILSIRNRIAQVIWINPMPTERWQSEFKILINGCNKIHACELKEQSLLRAIDLIKAAHQ